MQVTQRSQSSLRQSRAFQMDAVLSAPSFGGGAAAWIPGVLATPGTQGSWQLGQQEMQRSRALWQLVLANMLHYYCLEHPPSRAEKPGRPQSTRSQEWGTTKATLRT